LNHFYQRILFALLGGLIAAAGGGAVALWSDHLARKRERQKAIANRRLDFIEFMVQWKSKCEGWNSVGNGKRVTYYQETVDIFVGKASRIEGDFTDSTRLEAFKATRDKLAALQPNDVEEARDNKGKKLLLNAMQDVIDAV
jgi:hypothetical protein